MGNTWEDFPSLEHLRDRAVRERMERRRRHRQVRYLLFRMRNEVEQGRSADRVPDLPPHFSEFWLGEKAEYIVRPELGSSKLVRGKLPAAVAGKPVLELGGYGTFASKWDVDEDLVVYLRWSSVWQEWNATLSRVVPVLGD